VWFVALRHPSGESSSSAPAASAPAASGQAPAGSASAAAQTRAAAHTRVYHGAARTRSSASASAATRAAHSAHKPATGVGANAKAHPHAAALEHELAQGKVAVVLFWNPKSADDRHVREQLDNLGHGDRQIAVQVARSSEVTSFGQFTRTVQVTGTPTVLIVNPHYQATTVTGLTDGFSLQQAIGDAKEGVGRVLAPHFSSWTPTSSRAKFIDEANHVCPAPRSTIVATLRSSLAGVKTVQGVAGALLNTIAVVAEAAIHRVESLRMPARDRAFVHRQYALYLQGVHRVSAAYAPGTATALQRRAESFEGQADIDQASNALVAYGLTNCK
jgi:hypothetical protein